MTTKYALIIANTEYQDEHFSKLTSPGKDAERFSKVLCESGFPMENVQILLNEEDGVIRRKISRFFKNRQKDDLLLLYFSCHGIRDEQGRLFLAVKNTDRDVLDATGISTDFVTNVMDNSFSKRQVLILDCCLGGAFSYGTKSDQAVGQSMGIKTAFEGDGYGRWVLTAADANEYAWDGGKIIGNTENSLYTHFLIEGLNGEADQDGDGTITINELHDYARQKVQAVTDKQKPKKWSYKEDGDILLRNNLKPRVKSASIKPELLSRLSDPDSRIRRIGIEELISLFEIDDRGLARAVEEKLLEVAEKEDSKENERLAREALKDRGVDPAILFLEVEAKNREKEGGLIGLWKALWLWGKIKRLAPKHPEADSKIRYIKGLKPIKQFWKWFWIILACAFLLVLVSVSYPLVRPPRSPTPSTTVTDTPNRDGVATLTATSSFTPSPSETLTITVSPTLTSTLTLSPTPLVMVETNLNCRLGPAEDYARVVQIPKGESVEVNGRNDQGDWLWITWLDARTQEKYECWLIAEPVDFTVNLTAVHTKIPLERTPTRPPRTGPEGEIITVSAPGQVACPAAEICGVPVKIVWRNGPTGNRLCVFVHPELPGQKFFLQFEGTSGTAYIGTAPDNTAFSIEAVSTASGCSDGNNLPPGFSSSATVIRINQ